MSTDNDLVARLRIRWDAMGDMANDERAAAATEIERLRAERDEARREYCRGFTDFCPNPAHDELTLEEAAMEVAKSFGWDCFKEDGK